MGCSGNVFNDQIFHPGMGHRGRLIRRAGLVLGAAGLVAAGGVAGHKYAQKSYLVAPSLEEHRFAVGIEGERPGYGRKEKYEAVRRGGTVNRFLFPNLRPAEFFNMWFALPANAREDYLKTIKQAADRYVEKYVKDSDVADIENQTHLMIGRGDADLYLKGGKPLIGGFGFGSSLISRKRVLALSHLQEIIFAGDLESNSFFTATEKAKIMGFVDRLSGEKIDFMKASVRGMDRENLRMSAKYSLGGAAIMGAILFLMTRAMNRHQRRKFLAQMERDMRRARRPDDPQNN